MSVVALSTIAILALGAAVVVGLAFVGGIIALVLRNRPERRPPIPAGMRPGPSDETLERRKITSVTGWSMLFIIVIAISMAVVWLGEPRQNVGDELHMIEQSVDRGGRWFASPTEHNPTGYDCARCHGDAAEGGVTAFTQPDGEVVPEYPVPSLVDVCGRMNLDQVRDTIMQGREGTPMPSWSIRFEGPMNDQQIHDLLNFLITIQDVPEDQNQCLDPGTADEDTGDPAGAAT